MRFSFVGAEKKAGHTATLRKKEAKFAACYLMSDVLNAPVTG